VVAIHPKAMMMREYKMRWWKFQSPELWKIDEVHGTATIWTPHGNLQLSGASTMDCPASDEDLEAFAAEPINAGVPFSAVTCGDFSGFQMEYRKGSTHYRRWFLRSQFTIVCPGYWCALDHIGKDNEIVDAVVKTLQRMDSKPVR
jgi:hypothetical protein